MAPVTVYLSVAVLRVLRRQVQAAWRPRAVADAAGGRPRWPGDVDNGLRPRAGHFLSVHGASSQPTWRRSL